MCVRKTHLALAGLALVATLPVLAQTANRPRRIGDFQRWTAATLTERGEKVCYAFATAARTQPSRRNVLLLVTHRPGARNQVAIQSGYTYPRNADVKVSVGSSEFRFYTHGQNAFARDGGTAIAAFRRGREAIAQGPRANGRGLASDSFPLAGFTAAYDAISRECPARRRRDRS